MRSRRWLEGGTGSPVLRIWPPSFAIQSGRISRRRLANNSRSVSSIQLAAPGRARRRTSSDSPAADSRIRTTGQAENLGLFQPLWTTIVGPSHRDLFQSREGAAADLRFHYDRSNEFYARFLDQAQLAKLDSFCRKLDLQPGDAFLDVACGGALLSSMPPGLSGAGFGLYAQSQPVRFCDFRRRGSRTSRIVLISSKATTGTSPAVFGK